MGTSPRTAVEKRTDGRKERSPLFWLGIAAVSVVLLIVLILAGLLAVGFYQIENSPRVVEPAEKPDVKPKTYTLTLSQQEIRKRDGDPHTFVILFYTVEDTSGGKVEVRDETWTYFNLKKVYQFINGEFQGESPLPVEVTTSTRIPCKPEQFINGMSLDEIIAAVHMKRYMEIPLEDELVPGSRLYYADRLTFALQDGKLRYIETLPLEGEGK